MAKKPNVRIIPRGGISILSCANMLETAQAAHTQLKKRGINSDDVQQLKITRHPCGEVKPKIAKNVRGKEVFFFYGFTNGNFNDELMTLFLTLNALDKADCKRTTLILPFFPYTRQDRKDEARVPLSARVVIDMLCLSSSLERLVTLDMHAEQIELAFPARVKIDHLPGSLLMTSWMKEVYSKETLRDLVVIAPDNGSAKRAKKLARLIAPDVPIAIFDKDHTNDGTEVGAIIGAPVEGKICLINDDMIDTGGTIVDAANELRRLGAKDVIISATHPVFSTKKGKTAYETVASAGVPVVVTNSLPTEERKWLVVIPIGTLLGNVIFENITSNGSVSKIINGEV